MVAEWGDEYVLLLNHFEEAVHLHLFPLANALFKGVMVLLLV